ncbi:hypothetical protein [Hoeflea alexandrii]|uniref:Uncharacterized protein n=1 Tax=Hoeflea alexandrii TaxID=288436 RepID=A0ABT1CTG1_9HYPH|nr:hypothetical protein [Hoeflea alexandrii]MCO6409487.1 hypothetical protein [Hoeflea alexandrii]MCY0152518.1 hypothetical protein [Hoeflea alexandrii]
MSALFGKSTEIYGRIVNDIAHDLIKERYTFEDISEFERKSRDEHTGREYTGRVYWTEMLCRAHMSSVASIFRTTRWIQVAIREHDAGSLYGCASACRSLIESAGDIGHSLNPVALTLAGIKDAVKAEISGKAGETMILSEDLENSFIHFTHARKVGKTETAPDSHKAMQAFQYINMVERMKIVGVKAFYADLCEIVHPAAESVRVTFVPDNDAWIVDPLQERAVLDAMIAERKQALQGIVMASYNAPLMILRVLHAFDIFTKLPGLRKYQFDKIPEWKKIEAVLRS